MSSPIKKRSRRGGSSPRRRPDSTLGAPACTIVVIGRPNVGKSTLFNRLISRRRALVHNEPGVTRDRIEEKASWWYRKEPVTVRLIDTGGLGGERFAEEIKEQVQVALKEADICFFVLDGRAGVLPADEELIRELQKEGVMKRIPTLGVINKIDAETHESLSSEFYSLGFDEFMTVSAEHGRGIDDIQTWALEQMDARKLKAAQEAAANAPEVTEDDEEETDEELTDELVEEFYSEFEEPLIDAIDPDGTERRRMMHTPSLAIVGRPNVGKSTLVNALLGTRRMVVSPIAGTTVDSIDTITEMGGQKIVLIDTAGIRRKNKTEQGIEVLSVVQTRKALERASVAVLMLDAETGPTDQDEKIAGLIEDAGCSVIIAMNKWDLSEKGFEQDDAAERIRAEMRFLSYAPVIFMSAKKGKGIDGLGELVQEILHQRSLRIPTHEFTEWVRREAEVHNPANARFYMCHQSGQNPPTFVCHVNDPGKVHFSLQRHLINAMRERWGYMGTPIRLLIVETQSRRVLPRQQEAPRRGPKKASQVWGLATGELYVSL